MSASSRPTLAPAWASARARLTATVDLPTPPLPLATATTWRMPGSDTFCWGPAPWECMGVISFGERFAQVAEVFERVDAGVVAVIPDDLVGVVADRLHVDRAGRAGL